MAFQRLFTTPAPTMPTVNTLLADETLRRVWIYLTQRMDVLRHIQQDGAGPLVIQMQSQAQGVANVFTQDRIGLRQDGSNFLQGAFELNQQTIVGSVVPNYALQPTDFTLCCDATSVGPAGMLVYLPRSTLVPGRVYTVKKIDGSANKVVITAFSGDFVEFVTTLGLVSKGSAAMIQADGTNKWFQIGKV